MNAEDIVNPLLRDRVQYLKETKGGQEKMCEIMENRIREEKLVEKTELAKKAISHGKLSLEDIAETLGLSLTFVRELAGIKQNREV